MNECTEGFSNWIKLLKKQAKRLYIQSLFSRSTTKSYSKVINSSLATPGTQFFCLITYFCQTYPFPQLNIELRHGWSLAYRLISQGEATPDCFQGTSPCAGIEKRSTTWVTKWPVTTHMLFPYVSKILCPAASMCTLCWETAGQPSEREAKAQSCSLLTPYTHSATLENTPWHSACH